MTDPIAARLAHALRKLVHTCMRERIDTAFVEHAIEALRAYDALLTADIPDELSDDYIQGWNDCDRQHLHAQADDAAKGREKIEADIDHIDKLSRAATTQAGDIEYLVNFALEQPCQCDEMVSMCRRCKAIAPFVNPFQQPVATAPVVADEIAWLLERKYEWLTVKPGILWLSYRPMITRDRFEKGTVYCWTNDANKAIRFARREDAEALRLMLETFTLTDEFKNRDVVAIEHAWIAPHPAQPQEREPRAADWRKAISEVCGTPESGLDWIEKLARELAKERGK